MASSKLNEHIKPGNENSLAAPHCLKIGSPHLSLEPRVRSKSLGKASTTVDRSFVRFGGRQSGCIRATSDAIERTSPRRTRRRVFRLLSIVKLSGATQIDFEDGFVDEDELWTVDLQETPAQQTLRARKALDALFSTNSNTYISITSHSGTIFSLLAAIGHRPWWTKECDMVPLVIKAVREGETTPLPDAGPSATAPPCPSGTSGEARREL